MSAVVQAVGLLKTKEAVDLGGDYLDVLGAPDSSRSQRGWAGAVSRLVLGFFGPSAGARRRTVLEMARVREGDQVIDVGCGAGECTRHLARAAGEGLTIGLDASEEVVATAAANGGRENLAYLRGDACALPFEDETFDVACSVGAIEAAEEPMAAIGEMVRVLAPGGRLVIAASRARGDELTAALRERGLCEVERRVTRRGQVLAAQKPAEEVDDGR
ncbi:MAG TPA: methyltransferase domain-containing protein [Solirubrobacterales bacterium]|nr:methyltransferase domain-containing protein [Solirubrobacterales bacterium]